MKLLNRLTISSLRLNKKRTIVTIIGIILATSLLAAVSTMAVSFQQSLIIYEQQKTGDFHYGFLDVPQEELTYIEKNKNVESYFLTSGIGYATLADSTNPDKPYLYVEAMDEAAFSNIPVKLTEGRLPQNSSELVISKHIYRNGGVDYKVGQTLTLDIGNRLTKDGEILTQESSYLYEKEELETNETKTYTIVGICERLSTELEQRMAPGYTVITGLDDQVPTATNNIYVRYTKSAIKNRAAITAEILGVNPEIYEKSLDISMTLEPDEIENLESSKYVMKENRYLIYYETLDVRDSTLSMMYSVAAIVLVIIIFTSAFCIRNSFAISISEKMKQYGMLASIGATSKQIRRNVFYEAFLLGIIGIPIGILSGIAACAVLLYVVERLLGDVLSFSPAFAFSIPAVLLSILLAVVMIIFSARKPAKEAGRVSPIEAISGSTEIKISPKEVRCPKLIEKCFRIGGKLAYKNMKRNRKKYRVSVISISVSVIVFIPLFYFMNLAFSSVDHYVGNQSYNLSVISYNAKEDYEQFLEIQKLDGVNESNLVRGVIAENSSDTLKITDDYLKYYDAGMTSANGMILEIRSIGDDGYEAYCKKLGISPDKENQVIVINDFMEYNFEEEKYEVGDIYANQVGDKIAITLDEGEQLELEVAALTAERPMGYESSYSALGYFIVSDSWLNQHAGENLDSSLNLYMNCEDADVIQKAIQENFSSSEVTVHNLQQNYRESQALYTIVAIFLYGFIAVISLIGITNIFNTITTAMELRSKEFAMLRSMGMTSWEFRRMVNLESIFYGGKALLIGVPVGSLLSYLIYDRMAEGMDAGFEFPWLGVLIAVAAVSLLLYMIMRYSMNRIRKQNIIETIRQDNI